MRIVVDLQGAQSESRFRGIGRYSLSLARAMAKNSRGHELIIALSGLFPATVEPIRREFDGLLPRENIRVWHAPGPVLESEQGTLWRRQAAERLREAFLAGLNPDVVHVTSLFEGFVDDAVTSIGLFDTRTPVFVTLYDLIPLLRQDEYLRPNPPYRNFYLSKVEHLKRAQGWLCISESTSRESIQALELDRDSVFTISTACDPIFGKSEVVPKDRDELLAGLCISKPFVLYTGGADTRKNLPGLIRAFARLPHELREIHQLVFAGRLTDWDRKVLRTTAQRCQLPEGTLVFTGYVSDQELVLLYNLCSLFVFPSRHEGFGLPVLEAMSCGAPVVCANTSSLPEVICFEQALFDPGSEEDMARKMIQALSDSAFRTQLVEHGMKQAGRFSWDASAGLALDAMEAFHAGQQKAAERFYPPTSKRPKLAYVSPLEPLRSGIASYSAELLPQLDRFYDIEVVVDQLKVTDPWVKDNCPVRDVDWLVRHGAEYDRVLYHFGNSPYHKHMFRLLKQVPGVVSLHDFFMSSYSHHMETIENVPFYWTKDLYHSHGYQAVAKRCRDTDERELIYNYPCNVGLLQKAVGVIVHSEFSKELANQWYGSGSLSGRDWIRIPLIRTPNPVTSGQYMKSRKQLGLKKNHFVVCAFGLLDPTKLNHRLLEAWLKSNLVEDPLCRLIFVGENHGGEYGNDLTEIIRRHRLSESVHITGWVEEKEYRDYLEAADVAVQLRCFTRGESSRAVLDCMSRGLPTIVNAHGPMAELSPDAVVRLQDEFETADLVKALEDLRLNIAKRRQLGATAQETIRLQHAPTVCAAAYARAIEAFYQGASTDRHHLIRSIAKLEGPAPTERLLRELSSCITQNQPDKRPSRNFFIDISATCRRDLKSGIERVARGLLLEFLKDPPEGYRVEPVYLDETNGFWHYRYARRYTLEFLDCPSNWLEDDVIEPQPGDVLLIADMSGHMLVQAQNGGLFRRLQNAGISIHAIVFDLLPLRMPQHFPPGADKGFRQWLDSLCDVSDGLLGISRATADDVKNWLEETDHPRRNAIKVDWFHLGADIAATRPTTDLPEGHEDILQVLQSRPTFLMVGTIEPRKGHLQVIEAFDRIWGEGHDVNLVIVGQEGWKDVPEKMRRTIPKIVSTLRTHPELGRRLFWLEGISDVYLEKVYAAAACLIAASEGEGFGLPLIEAARHGVPVLARDIPVFREVAGDWECVFVSGIFEKELGKLIIRLKEMNISKNIKNFIDSKNNTWEKNLKIVTSIIFEK